MPSKLVNSDAKRVLHGAFANGMEPYKHDASMLSNMDFLAPLPANTLLLLESAINLDQAGCANVLGRVLRNVPVARKGYSKNGGSAKDSRQDLLTNLNNSLMNLLPEGRSARVRPRPEQMAATSEPISVKAPKPQMPLIDYYLQEAVMSQNRQSMYQCWGALGHCSCNQMCRDGHQRATHIKLLRWGPRQ